MLQVALPRLRVQVLTNPDSEPVTLTLTLYLTLTLRLTP